MSIRNRTGFHISEFKPGQVLTRLEPAMIAKPDPYGLSESYAKEKIESTDYIGEALEYVGVENNMIYFISTNNSPITMLMGGNGSNVIKLPITDWCEGWGVYVDIVTAYKKNKENNEKQNVRAVYPKAD